ncbi:MAG: hypothetical protein L3K14_02805 [Thermoplasmata archaeon]|nr:hypothetical protein [Thermoplasmata archaeon]
MKSGPELPGNCFFCERLAGPGPRREPLIYEDSLVHVTHWSDWQGPSYQGAALIQTKRHTDGGLPTLTLAEGGRIGRLVVEVSRALRDVVGAAWTYTYCFTEGYRHVHQFVVARYPNTPAKYKRLKVTEWQGAPHGTPAQIRKLAQRLGAALESSGPAGPTS